MKDDKHMNTNNPRTESDRESDLEKQKIAKQKLFDDYNYRRRVHKHDNSDSERARKRRGSIKYFIAGIVLLAIVVVSWNYWEAWNSDIKLLFDNPLFNLPFFCGLLGLFLFVIGLHVLISNTSKGGAGYNKEYNGNRATGIIYLILAGILTLISLFILSVILILLLNEDAMFVFVVPMFPIFLVPGILLMISGIRRLKKRSSMQNSS
jgi:hypothetical protein